MSGIVGRWVGLEGASGTLLWLPNPVSVTYLTLPSRVRSPLVRVMHRVRKLARRLRICASTTIPHDAHKRIGGPLTFSRLARARADKF